MNKELKIFQKVSKRVLKKLLKHPLNPLRIGHNSYKLSQKAGAPPGTLVYTGISKDEMAEITLHRYNTEGIEVYQSEDVTEILQKMDLNQSNWINISALNNVEIVRQVGEHFSLHPLVMEDILTTQQLPNMEDYDTYIFFTLKMLSINPETHQIEQEHVSLILGDNYLLSFQERKVDVLKPLRERLQNHKGRIRTKKVDYLLYALIDVIVDNYYLVTEDLNEKIAELELEMLAAPDHSSVEKVAGYKKRLLHLKRVIFPLREALRRLTKEEDELITSQTVHYIEDVISNVEHIIQTMETQREMLTQLMELYMSTLSNRMNNVMKTLTVIATIFIPLTFVAGVYGMNFEYMPELGWKWGYPAVWGVMFVIGLVMLLYMKSKKWF